MKHLFTNGTDTVIAENQAEAMTVWEDFTGDVDMSQEWTMIPDDQSKTVYFEDEIKPEYLPVNHTRRDLPEDASSDIWTHCITAKAGDWANCNWQDDFLCSTEY